MRILVLEDDQNLAKAFALRLRDDGHAVDVALTFSEAVEALGEVDYDVVVLDRMVPGGDSLDLVAEVRKRGDQVPVLILSARGGTEDRIDGLTRGADDYLAKPVDLHELSLRVTKLIVRKAAHSDGRLRVGRVSIDPERRMGFIDDELIKLSRLQFAILEYLFLQGDRPVSAEELLDHVWDGDASPFSSAVGPQMSRIRDVFRGVLKFTNQREVGYRIEPVEPEDEPTKPEESEGG